MKNNFLIKIENFIQTNKADLLAVLAVVIIFGFFVIVSGLKEVLISIAAFIVLLALVVSVFYLYFWLCSKFEEY